MQLARTGGKLSGTARDLGINVSLLRKWMNAEQEKGEAACPGQGKPVLTPEQQEIQRLRKENEISRQEREILNKAAAFFAKETTR
ncbi:transposase [Deinococcus budaensis]|uniref:Transposase n=1 Tax=Deinococcus budaensis TaxID=1665626 RepID=A0A7W8GGA8_9DEIO|nr:transposase [Deinococcus budaensis]